MQDDKVYQGKIYSTLDTLAGSSIRILRDLKQSRSLLVAISWQRGFLNASYPTHDCKRCCVSHDDESKYAERDVCKFSEAGFGHGFIVKEWLLICQ